jgi:hypothetical protein
MATSRFHQPPDRIYFLGALQAFLSQRVVRINHQGDIEFLPGQLRVALIQRQSAFIQQLFKGRIDPIG